MTNVIKPVKEFQTKMAEKGWNMEYDKFRRKFVDPEVQKQYEAFFVEYIKTISNESDDREYTNEWAPGVIFEAVQTKEK